jgi:hypothetical protein
VPLVEVSSKISHYTQCMQLRSLLKQQSLQQFQTKQRVCVGFKTSRLSVSLLVQPMLETMQSKLNSQAIAESSQHWQPTCNA